MPHFRVTGRAEYSYRVDDHKYIDQVVEADNEETAIQAAYDEIENDCDGTEFEEERNQLIVVETEIPIPPAWMEMKKAGAPSLFDIK